jgi:pyruvyl transferase EpsO
MVDDGEQLDPPVESIRRRVESEILRVLEGLLPSGCPVAHVDFPAHDNAGDSAIWVAERRWLAVAGHAVEYSASHHDYDARRLDQRLGDDGAILLHGGGNFGDLYPFFHAHRCRIIRDHPRRQIVVLPQTIRFSDAPVEPIPAHDDVTVLCRDHESLEWARENIDADARFCHDSVFSLPLPAALTSANERFVLQRTDREKTDMPAGRDWLRPSELPRRTWLVSRLVRQGWAAAFVSAGAWDRLQAAAASGVMTANLRLFGAAATVETNRLHAAVLAWLQGRTVIVHENSYGKLARVLSATVPDDPRITYARA